MPRSRYGDTLLACCCGLACCWGAYAECAKRTSVTPEPPVPNRTTWMPHPGRIKRASEDNPHGSGAGMHHAPPLSQRPSSRVKTPAIRGFLTRDNVILTCPAAQSGENGLITDAHTRRGCGIHALRPGTGGAGVTGVRFRACDADAAATS